MAATIGQLAARRRSKQFGYKLESWKREGAACSALPETALACSKKKAAWFPRRPFLSYGSFNINGRFQDLCTGGLSPGRILIGSRCLSVQSRLRSDSVAVVSHLRKMTTVKRETGESAIARRQLSPLLTGGWQFALQTARIA